MSENSGELLGSCAVNGARPCTGGLVKNLLYVYKIDIPYTAYKYKYKMHLTYHKA